MVLLVHVTENGVEFEEAMDEGLKSKYDIGSDEFGMLFPLKVSTGGSRLGPKKLSLS